MSFDYEDNLWQRLLSPLHDVGVGGGLAAKGTTVSLGGFNTRSRSLPPFLSVLHEVGVGGVTGLLEGNRRARKPTAQQASATRRAWVLQAGLVSGRRSLPLFLSVLGWNVEVEL